MKHTDVVAVSELAEKIVKQGMLDGILDLIGLEVPFCHVGRMLRFVAQNMVPGLLLGWPAPGHLLIPFFGALKRCIDINDDPAIVKKPVMHKLTDAKFAGRLIHESPEPQC